MTQKLIKSSSVDRKRMYGPLDETVRYLHEVWEAAALISCHVELGWGDDKFRGHMEPQFFFYRETE